jgi:hypothetical protein
MFKTWIQKKIHFPTLLPHFSTATNFFTIPREEGKVNRNEEKSEEGRLGRNEKKTRKEE